MPTQAAYYEQLLAAIADWDARHSAVKAAYEAAQRAYLAGAARRADVRQPYEAAAAAAEPYLTRRAALVQQARQLQQQLAQGRGPEPYTGPDLLAPAAPAVELVPVEPPAAAPLATPAIALPLESLIAAWLHAKGGKSGSSRTHAVYQETLIQFRTALQAVGLDLDGDPTAIALAAQGWAAGTTRKTNLAPATYNQRLAVLSSFYEYAIRHGQLVDNPIRRVERRQVQSYGAAVPLDYATLQRRLRAIDRTTPAGLRDYALLSVALHTGRRVSELASLRWADLHLVDAQVTLQFPRAKGGKVMRDLLPRAPAKALLRWLYAHYGAQLGDLAPDAPLWPSLSRQNAGHPLTPQAIADVCERWLGVSKVHTLRHTFARAMEDSGAKVSEIQARLGHTNLATTGRYLAALRSAENTHGEQLSRLFGVDDDDGG